MSKQNDRLYKRFLQNRQTQSPEDADHGSNWAVSYGDMVTLLLAFFVLFFSIDKGSGDLKQLDKQVQNEFEQKRKPADVTWGNVEEFKSKDLSQKQIRELIHNIKTVETNLKGNRLLVEFPRISFFKSARTDLTRDGEDALKRFAKIFNKFEGRMRIVVRGYTDNRPVKFSSANRFKDNLELSAFRAVSALRVLNSNGIPHQYMRIGGYGETDKDERVSPKDTWSYDRKIVLVVEPLDHTERGIHPDDWSRKPGSKEKPVNGKTEVLDKDTNKQESAQ